MRVTKGAVFAENMRGVEVCLTDQRETLTIKFVDRLIDVTGSVDGARTIAEVVKPCLETSMSKCEKVRLKDSPDSLARAFRTAGLHVPPVTQPTIAAKAVSLFTGKSGPNLDARIRKLVFKHA